MSEAISAKNRMWFLLLASVCPPILAPLLAFLIFKDNPGWAIAGGLVVGIILAAVGWGLFVIYNEMLDAEERQKSQTEQVRKAVHGGDAADIAILNMQKLDEYYALSKSQARNSFAVSIGAVCVGFAAILIAARFASSDPKQAGAGALAGILLNFIGGGFFVVYNKSLEQLKLFYGKLVQLQDTMLAVQQCEKLPHDAAARVRETVIIELIHRRFSERDATRSTVPRTGTTRHTKTERGRASKREKAAQPQESIALGNAMRKAAAVGRADE